MALLVLVLVLRLGLLPVETFYLLFFFFFFSPLVGLFFGLITLRTKISPRQKMMILSVLGAVCYIG